MERKECSRVIYLSDRLTILARETLAPNASLALLQLWLAKKGVVNNYLRQMVCYVPTFVYYIFNLCFFF
jgi:hypothetical protein